MTIRALRHSARAAGVISGITLLALCGTASSAPIDHVRLSRTGSVTTVEIELGCAMHYRDHSPPEGGIELRVQVELGQDCINALRNTPSARYRPVGAQLARMTNVDFDSVGRNQAMITLRFDGPVRYRLHQTANRYLLTLLVQPSAGTQPATPAPLAETVTPPSDVPVTRAPDPARRVHRPQPAEHDKFVIRLRELQSATDVDRDTLRGIRSHVIYTNEVVLSGQRWVELRMGFFDTEEAALSALRGVRTSFPDAWITIAAPAEQAIAQQQRLPEPEDVPTRAPPPAAAKSDPESPALEDSRVAELMVEAKSAIVRSDYDRSIRIYTKLLEESHGTHRREAREFLGVARQKNGQLAHAKAEFKAYLAEFPDGPGTGRVRQRLAALADTPVAAMTTNRPVHETTPDGLWQYQGGVSQFYLRGVDLSRDDEADRLAESALLSQADFYVTRRGERFDLLARGNISYLYEFADNGRDNQGRVSFAYIDLIDNHSNTSARIGRQTQYQGGILGRFDGAQISYSPWSDITLNVNAGLPVDTPRYLSSTDHYFFGGSIEIADFINLFDFSVFANLQTIDGISDRQAVGADAHYHHGALNIVGLIDYDASYNVINNAMVTGSWRFNDRLTLSGRYQGGAAPFLTTRNAIIGQPVQTVAALQEIYSEGQIRRLARNRTAEFRSWSTSLTAELSERWNVNTGMNYNEYGATTASGGVAAFPATGPMYDWHIHLLGASVIKTADSVNFGYRRRETRNDDANMIFADLRFPIGEGLRINPRVAVTRQQRFRSGVGATEQWVVDPMLRVIYRWRHRYRVEFEMGGRWSDEELPADALLPDPQSVESIETSAYYLHVGYWMDFGR